jgi:hypothetical protein
MLLIPLKVTIALALTYMPPLWESSPFLNATSSHPDLPYKSLAPAAKENQELSPLELLYLETKALAVKSELLTTIMDICKRNNHY